MLETLIVGAIIAVVPIFIGRIFDSRQEAMKWKREQQSFLLRRKVTIAEAAMAQYSKIKNLLTTLSDVYGNLPDKPNKFLGETTKGAFSTMQKQLDSILSASYDLAESVNLYFDLETIDVSREGTAQYISSVTQIGNHLSEWNAWKKVKENNQDEELLKYINGEMQKIEEEVIKIIRNLGSVFKSGADVYSDLMEKMKNEVRKLEQSI